MYCGPVSRLTLALFLIGGTLVGCQRGPRTTLQEVAQAEAAKPKAKVVRPAPETGLVRLRTVRAFREWGVRDTAADALARIGEAAVPALIDILHDDDPSIRAQAARALARMGPKAAPAVSELIVVLNDPDSEVRRGAARALGQIGPDAEDAVPALIKALKDPRNKSVVQPVEVETEVAPAVDVVE
ncbi:MAG TPA: HEAT repeat domain-containing protein [Pirellulales bacterium]|nr:HEAT repeat domain-containing protein [Pirellulales bacterium]